MRTPKNARRCAPGIESLEGRLCLAGSLGWDGPGLGSAALTYYIGGTAASLTQGAVESALTTALAAWSSVANITFTRTSLPNQPNSIDFTFRQIDGPGGTLAQAYYPDTTNRSRIAGDVQFDAAETWEIGNGLGSGAFDLVLTAVHEIGHALGLDHSSASDSVMQPTVSPDASYTGLGASDKTAILALYAPAATPTATTPTTTSNTSTTTDTTPTTPTVTTPSTPTNTDDNTIVPSGPRARRLARLRQILLLRRQRRLGLVAT